MNRLYFLSNMFATALIFLFVYTAFSKYFDYEGFVGSMDNQPLPGYMKSFLVIALPPLEIAAAILLAIPKRRKIGFIFSTLLMTVFTLYVAAGLAGLFSYVPCTCGGVIKSLTWTQHLFFNLGFLLISIFGIVLESRSIQLERTLGDKSYFATHS